MFLFTNDPGADGVGVVFCDAVRPQGGILDLTGARGDRARSADWELVEDVLGLPVVNVDQVHGTRVLAVDTRPEVDSLAGERADGLVTSLTGIGLSVRVADCVPVLLADRDAGVVAAAHAGRVGLVEGVLAATVGAMRERGADAITAWIGPHICGSCYEVPEAMRDDVSRVLPAAAAWTSWGTPALDLGAAAVHQLEGLRCVVRRHDPCTRTTPTLHSFRRDGVAGGRQAGIIWLVSR